MFRTHSQASFLYPFDKDHNAKKDAACGASKVPVKHPFYGHGRPACFVFFSRNDQCSVNLVVISASDFSTQKFPSVIGPMFNNMKNLPKLTTSFLGQYGAFLGDSTNYAAQEWKAYAAPVWMSAVFSPNE